MKFNIEEKFTGKLVIMEDREDGRYLRFQGSKFSFTFKRSEATYFDNLQRVNQAMEKYQVPDFGLTIVPTQREGDLIKIQRVIRAHRKINLDIDSFTKANVKSLLYNSSTFSYLKLPKTLANKNRVRLKTEVFKNMNKLIDLHNQANKVFAVAPNVKNSGEIKCNGCAICNEIAELAAFLDKPYMSKIYHVENYKDTNRYKKFNMNNLEELNEMYHDFLILRESGYGLNQISEFYGIDIEQGKLNYDKLLDSEFHETIGRSERTNEFEPRRKKLDLMID